MERLGKRYELGQRAGADSFREMLWGGITAPFQRGRQREVSAGRAGEFWGLKDVSFEIAQGDVVGIIGRNGAGKSTLLKILSQIVEPTEGRAEVRGRVATLLEVGTGFHGELTGRENIYLNGAILGMTHAEIARRFDEIVAFAEVAQFIDTPVKRYSSGMYVRLAFAVAAHLEPDIMIIDEVLAVGDAEFQKRCLGRIRDVASQGRTVLFVSHNHIIVRKLCTHGLLLDKGRAIAYGRANDVLACYASATINKRELPHSNNHEDLSMLSVAALPLGGQAGDPILGTQPFVIRTRLQIPRPGRFAVSVTCHSEDGPQMFSTVSFFEKELDTPIPKGISEFDCVIPGHVLNDGSYVLDVNVVLERRDVLIREPSVLSFQIQDDFPTVDGWHWRPDGGVRPRIDWQCRSLGSSSLAVNT